MESAIATVGLFDGGFDYDPQTLLADVAVDERRRYRALPRNRQARQYLASRWLLRQHLASERDMAPLDVALRFNANGPPMLADRPDSVGLSHSHGLCLCMVSTQVRVGCDVEYQRVRRHDGRDIATHYFAAEEAAQLQAADPIQRPADFYRLWTLKEAGRKALGQGIAGGLQTPAFVWQPALRCLAAADAGPWTFAAGTLVALAGRCAVALAMRAGSGRFEVYRYTVTGQGALKRPLDLDLVYCHHETKSSTSTPWAPRASSSTISKRGNLLKSRRRCKK